MTSVEEIGSETLAVSIFDASEKTLAGNFAIKGRVLACSENFIDEDNDNCTDMLLADNTGVMVLRAVGKLGGLISAMNVRAGESYHFLFDVHRPRINNLKSFYKDVMAIGIDTSITLLPEDNQGAGDVSIYWSGFESLVTMVSFWGKLDMEQDPVNVIGTVVHVGGIITVIRTESPECYKEQVINIRAYNGRVLSVLLENTQTGEFLDWKCLVGGPMILAVVDGSVFHRGGKIFVKSKFLLWNPKNFIAVEDFFPVGFSYPLSWIEDKHGGIPMVADVDLSDLMERVLPDTPLGNYFVSVVGSVWGIGSEIVGTLEFGDLGERGVEVKISGEGDVYTAKIFHQNLTVLFKDNKVDGIEELEEFMTNRTPGKDMQNVVAGLVTSDAWVFYLEVVICPPPRVSPGLIIRFGNRRSVSTKKPTKRALSVSVALQPGKRG